ncbi:hypothetical protein TASIC1_0010040400 [Trichoderma asperellum]|uniref:Fungal STAND N-terminal Goodbye domain-containing protein n=1 Tax=Trichoderma asperellum TaxID=101201 RepID=A0A6V8R7K6_TRIAP|nr:hypothetical protein TASIC1_0010040400 [Trichoderma asperellum]
MATKEEEKNLAAEDIEKDNRDVADLWKEALKQYKGIVGFDLQPKFNNVQAMIDFGTGEMNAFHKFRHNSKKVDKLRSLFAANIDYIEKGAQQLISAATPAFPPAAAIGTAITYLLSACKQVSADYDVVVVFFEDMNSFLERVTILETRLPSHKAYQNCLMDVFTSFLTLTGYAHKYIELGRFKKWITNLIGGEDGDLSGARKKMDKDLTRLQNATEFAILGNSEELKKMNGELQVNQVEHTRMLEEQKEIMFSISQDTENIRSDVAKLLKAFTEQNAKHDHKGKPSSQEASKPASASRVRNAMPDVEGEGHEYKILKETLVPDTCTWVFSQPEWETWIKQDEKDAILSKPILALAGQPGTGKSHLAATVYDKLYSFAKEDCSQRTCVAHFYFREQHRDLCWFLKGIITVINQVVEQSAPLCERINAEMVRDEVFYSVWEWKDLLLKILGPSFNKDSPNRLFILFDGLDELFNFPQFLEFVKLVKGENFRISIVVTSRPELVQQLSEQTKRDSTHLVAKERLYKCLHRRMPVARQQIALKLLHWLAFSGRVLTLDEVTSLLMYLSQDNSFSLEEIPEVAAKFLQIGDPALDAESRSGRRNTYISSIEDVEKAESASNNPDDAYNDGALPVKFKERSMRAFFRDASTLNSDWHFTASEAYRQIFLDSVNLVKPLGPGHSIKETLRLYSAYWLLPHFVEIKLDEHTPQEKAEVMEGLAMALSHTDFAETLSRTGVVYDRSGKSAVNDKAALWAENLKIPEISSILTPSAASWWADVAIDPRRCRLGMVKGYLRLIYTAADVGAASAAYKLLYGLLGVGGLDDLLTDKAKENFPEEISAKAAKAVNPAPNNNENTESQTKAELGEEKSSLGLPDLFNDLEMDCTAYRAVGELFFHYNLYKPAEVMCNKANICFHSGGNDTEKFKISILQCNVLLKLHKKDIAFETILECVKGIETVNVPTSLKRLALLAKAKVETRLGMREAAAESYTQAKLIDPTGLTPGNSLVSELNLFEKASDHAGYFRTLKSWNSNDRLTWMAWNYCNEGDDRHEELRALAIKEGEAEFIIEAYKDAIQFLDRLNSGAPMRLELALTYFRVVGDLENARKYLDEIFASTSNGETYAITDEEPQTTLQRAVDTMSDVLYETFRASRDPSVKAEALAALKGLMDRPLSLAVPMYTSLDLVHRRIVIASMCLKMGQGSEFQERLQSILDDCFAGLNDKVSWNDGQNLEKLGHALMVLSKAIPEGQDIQRYARIVISAMFSKITIVPDEEDESDSDSDSGSDSDSDSDSDSGDGSSDDSDPQKRKAVGTKR